MYKENLLYVSPFPPQKSGISDYSEVLVGALKEYYNITILIENYKLPDSDLYKDIQVLVYKNQEIDFSQYKYVIYNIGNNPFYHSYIYKLCLKHPGLVILHDCVLYYLIAGYYESTNQLYSKLYEIGGTEAILVVKQAMQKEKKGILEYKDIASKLPLNKELAESGNKIMVHSEYAANMIKKYMPSSQRLRKINLIKQTKKDTKIIDKNVLFNKYHIPKDAVIVTSFGYIAETKLNDIVCKAVLNLNAELEKKICYVMVGEGDFADAYIDNKVIFKTGYVDLDEFNSFLEYSDIVANLRYPSMGETSAAMIRIMEYGKPAIIVSDAWFAEIPEDCVISLKIKEVDRIEDEIKKLVCDEKFRTDLGNRAKKYVDEFHSEQKICEEINDFLKAE